MHARFSFATTASPAQSDQSCSMPSRQHVCQSLCSIFYAPDTIPPPQPRAGHWVEHVTTMDMERPRSRIVCLYVFGFCSYYVVYVLYASGSKVVRPIDRPEVVVVVWYRWRMLSSCSRSNVGWHEAPCRDNTCVSRLTLVCVHLLERRIAHSPTNDRSCPTLFGMADDASSELSPSPQV